MKLSETEKENITLKVICDQYLVKKLTNDLKFCQETANLIYANNEAQRETIIVQDSVIRNLQELISCKKLGCIPCSSLVIHMSGAAWPHDALSLAETSLENNTATNLHHKTQTCELPTSTPCPFQKEDFDSGIIDRFNNLNHGDVLIHDMDEDIKNSKTCQFETRWEGPKSHIGNPEVHAKFNPCQEYDYKATERHNIQQHTIHTTNSSYVYVYIYQCCNED